MFIINLISYILHKSVGIEYIWQGKWTNWMLKFEYAKKMETLWSVPHTKGASYIQKY